MLIRELLLNEAKVSKTIEPITISKAADDRWEVATKSKVQPTIGVIFEIVKRLVQKSASKVKITNLKGKVTNKTNFFDLYTSKPSRFFVSSDSLSDADLEDLLIKTRYAAIAATERSITAADNAAAKRASPAYKKEVNAVKAAAAKSKAEDHDKIYGKGTWKRTSIKQEGGDDGYHYVLRVDGKVKMSGLTRREAEYEQRKAADAIAKREKIGNYAE